MTNKNAYKGKTKTEASFIRGIDQARKRAASRDRQKQMVEGEKVRAEAKKRRQKSKRKK